MSEDTIHPHHWDWLNGTHKVLTKGRKLARAYRIHTSGLYICRDCGVLWSAKWASPPCPSLLARTAHRQDLNVSSPPARTHAASPAEP